MMMKTSESTLLPSTCMINCLQQFLLMILVISLITSNFNFFPISALLRAYPLNALF